MRQERNNEIDLLLRRLSRHDGETVRDAETQMDDRHLDADELSSYAQNVLPPAARTRYMEHLAECSTCRRLATELSLALGATGAAAPVETVPVAGGLKKFLAGLLSPMVLRYAVPALGVIVVMVIGFVVLRQREAQETVAQVGLAPPPSAGYIEPGVPAEPAARTDEQQRQQSSANARSGPAPGNSAPEEAANSPAAKTGNKEGTATGTADTAAAVAPVTVATPGDIQPFIAERSVTQLPVIQPTPPPPSAPKANISMDGEDAKAKKETAAKRDTEPGRTDEAKDAREKEQANEPATAVARPAAGAATDSVAQNKARPQGELQTAGAGRRPAKTARAEEDKDEAETRSIAGRKFRKVRGIWTDTAYDSSTRTTNMDRGSEQFRALVGDEPAIGTIAKQLDGEVIVVWKGRPYRIR